MKVYRVQSTLSRCAESAVDGRATTSPSVVASVFRDMFGFTAKEIFAAFLLDGKHRIVAAEQVSVGTLTSSLVHPREVFGPAVRLGTIAAIVVAHNHPSGDPTPSAEDIDVTKRLVEAGKLLGIPVLDHVVVGEQIADDSHKFYSFRSNLQAPFEG